MTKLPQCTHTSASRCGTRTPGIEQWCRSSASVRAGFYRIGTENLSQSTRTYINNPHHPPCSDGTCGGRPAPGPSPPAPSEQWVPKTLPNREGRIKRARGRSNFILLFLLRRELIQLRHYTCAEYSDQPNAHSTEHPMHLLL